MLPRDYLDDKHIKHHYYDQFNNRTIPCALCCLITVTSLMAIIIVYFSVSYSVYLNTSTPLIQSNFDGFIPQSNSQFYLSRKLEAAAGGDSLDQPTSLTYSFTEILNITDNMQTYLFVHPRYKPLSILNQVMVMDYTLCCSLFFGVTSDGDRIFRRRICGNNDELQCVIQNDQLLISIDVSFIETNSKMEVFSTCIFNWISSKKTAPHVTDQNFYERDDSSEKEDEVIVNIVEVDIETFRNI